ncbi:MAG: hypothetical protein R6T96_07015 [Longimicrobiales bacterium]
MRGKSAGIVPVLLGLALGACASNSAPPAPGHARGGVPDLRGHRVLVLPVQLREGIHSGVTADEEIAYALPSRGERVSWVFPADVEGILSRSPGIEATLYDLQVGIFLQAEVNRVGDPLYGEIRRLTTLAGADIALIPIALTYAEGAYNLTVTLLSPVTGRVLWFSVIRGEAGPADAPGTLASVSDALARALLPLG